MHRDTRPAHGGTGTAPHLPPPAGDAELKDDFRPTAEQEAEVLKAVEVFEQVDDSFWQ